MTITDSDRSTRRVVVTGASGLIGSALVTSLRSDGHPVTRLVRAVPKDGLGPDDALWDPAAGTIDGAALDGAWAVVNLAGQGIGEGKWTDEHKRKVLDSRVQGTLLLATTMAALERKPAIFASGSAIGFYGDRGATAVDERAEPGRGFLADVVVAWEAAAAPASAAGIPVAFLRTGIVMSTKGGALKQQLLPFRLGIGGRLGSGDQYLSWISLDDEVGAIRFLLDSTIPGGVTGGKALTGPVNIAAPNPVTNAAFTKALGKALHRPTLLPIPLAPLRLRYGSDMVQEMLLSSTRVQARTLTAHGYVFQHPDLETALGHLLSTHG
jgi:uncharacterized protein (TIGR01777 family)